MKLARSLLFIFAFLHTNIIDGQSFENSHYFTKEDMSNLCGDIASVSGAWNIGSCSMSCLWQKTCKGFLFGGNLDSTEKCKLVLSGTGISTNKTEFEEYELFLARKRTRCKNLLIYGATPEDWRSACPVLYFPLDNMLEGSARGSNASLIQFTGGVVDSSIHFPNPSGDNVAYFHLGHYPSTSYCFTTPARCPRGVTYAFWLNILEDTGTYQGVITTLIGREPGFSVLWSPIQGGYLNFWVQRDFGIPETCYIFRQDFVHLYGFGNWVHYVITYKYVGLETKNDMAVYFNGKVNGHTGRWHGTQKRNTTTQYYNGNMELGLREPGNPNDDTPNMKLDDLIIWQEQLTCDDVFRLYQAYNM